jgi:hypothetical protein
MTRNECAKGTNRAQVYRNVRRIGNETTGWVKDSTREVQTLFDVGADACFLESSAHLFGNCHESMTEDAEHDWIDFAVGLFLVCSVRVQLACR